MKHPLNNLQILSFLIIFCIFFSITHDPDLIKNANAQMSEEIVVAKVNGDEIQLKEVLDIIDQLPLDYQNQPLASYFDQIVDEVINTRLAAKAGEKSDLSDDPIVIEAMRISSSKSTCRKLVTYRTRKICYARSTRKSIRRLCCGRDI